LFALDEIT